MATKNNKRSAFETKKLVREVIRKLTDGDTNDKAADAAGRRRPATAARNKDHPKNGRETGPGM